MDKLELEKLVKNIVMEILPLLNKKVLIFLSGGTVNTEICFKVLADFDFVDYHLVISENAANMLDQDLIYRLKGKIVELPEELDDVIDEADLILLPILTRNTLSKLALGIADNLTTTGIARALMKNREIIAVTDSFDPENSFNRSKGLANNSNYNLMLNNYREVLENFGVKFVETVEFKETVKFKIDNFVGQTPGDNKPDILTQEVVFSSSILTLADIKNCQEGQIVLIQEGAIITPLAMDYIQSNRIRIKLIKSHY